MCKLASPVTECGGERSVSVIKSATENGYYTATSPARLKGTRVPLAGEDISTK